MTPRMHRSHRIAGALVGSVVGDALGAPFEFGPPGAFSERFPTPARGASTEMCGGGVLGWAPGEFTDDTQMALLVATSLLDRGGLDEADLGERLRSWLAAGPRYTGNGSLVGTAAAAILFSRSGTEATADAARRVSALTHGDPAAGEGCAIFHELMRVALDGEDPLAAIPAALELVAGEHRPRWGAVLAEDWTPEARTRDDAPGPPWSTLGRAVWALRRGRSFAEVLRLAIDLGGDTDTIAAAAGGLAGAVHGMAGIPMRWSSAVHGHVPGSAEKRWRLGDLQELAWALDGRAGMPFDRGVIPRLGPVEVLPGIWAANLDGARSSTADFAVISLCRLGEPLPHGVHRMAYLADNEHNTEIDAVLADVLADMQALHAEGHRILVHCHGGASRTGLVLRAWLRRTKGLSAREATDVVAENWPYLSLWNQSFGDALERVR